MSKIIRMALEAMTSKGPVQRLIIGRDDTEIVLPLENAIYVKFNSIDEKEELNVGEKIGYRIATESEELATIKPEEWIGVDLDGTLAFYDGWKGIEHIGAPIPHAIALIKRFLEAGVTVKIFTARVASEDPWEVAEAVKHIEAWCAKHLGAVLSTTNVKDRFMVRLYDDRARQLVENEGILVK